MTCSLHLAVSGDALLLVAELLKVFVVGESVLLVPPARVSPLPTRGPGSQLGPRPRGWSQGSSLRASLPSCPDRGHRPQHQAGPGGGPALCGRGTAGEGAAAAGRWAREQGQPRAGGGRTPSRLSALPHSFWTSRGSHPHGGHLSSSDQPSAHVFCGLWLQTGRAQHWAGPGHALLSPGCSVCPADGLDAAEGPLCGDQTSSRSGRRSPA